MKTRALICILTLALPAVAQANDPTPAAAQPASAKAKKICRQEQVLGSIIPAHICLTKEEWQKLSSYYEERDQSLIERRKAQFNAIQRPPPGQPIPGS